jgi:hypothetical protein
MDLELNPAPRGTSKARAGTTVSKGSLYSAPKTQATSVLPVAREESQRLSAPDFPEHGVRDFQAVPMDCGRFRQTVFQNKADTIALVHLDCGARA